MINNQLTITKQNGSSCSNISKLNNFICLQGGGGGGGGGGENSENYQLTDQMVILNQLSVLNLAIKFFIIVLKICIGQHHIMTLV